MTRNAKGHALADYCHLTLIDIVVPFSSPQCQSHAFAGMDVMSPDKEMDGNFWRNKIRFCVLDTQLPASAMGGAWTTIQVLAPFCPGALRSLISRV
jgi:hypothetical protein